MVARSTALCESMPANLRMSVVVKKRVVFFLPADA